MKYRLYTKVKVSMGVIIPSNEVARLINAIETVPRFITYFYHAYWLGSYLRIFSNYIKLNLATQTHNLTMQWTKKAKSLLNNSQNRANLN